MQKIQRVNTYKDKINQLLNIKQYIIYWALNINDEVFVLNWAWFYGQIYIGRFAYIYETMF